MKKRILIMLGVVILAGMFLVIRQQMAPRFECTDAIGCVTILPDQPVKLGVLQPLTGRLTDSGTGPKEYLILW